MNRTHIGLGIFVIGTFALLAWLAQSIGAIGGGGGDRYEVRLDHAAGLVTNNAVKIAGVEVGTIEKIGVDHDIALLTLRVDSEIVLHEDATAIVRAKSLLGEKYLQLHPGTRDGAVLEPGGQIVNVETHFEVDQVLNALEPLLGGEDSIGAVLGPLAERLAALMDDASGKSGKPPIITREEIEQMVDDVKETTATTRRIAADNEQDIRAIVQNTRTLTGDPRVPRMIGHAANIASTVDNRLPALLDRTENAIDKLENLAELVDKDKTQQIEKIIDDAEVTMANLRQASEEVGGLSETATELMDNLSTLAKRALLLDAKTIRQFIQTEGIKVFVGSKREAAKAGG